MILSGRELHDELGVARIRGEQVLNYRIVPNGGYYNQPMFVTGGWCYNRQMYFPLTDSTTVGEFRQMIRDQTGLEVNGDLLLTVDAQHTKLVDDNALVRPITRDNQANTRVVVW